MPTGNFDINELKRRMQGATKALKHELGGLRTGRAAASMLEPVQVDAYGTHMPLNQLATVSVPEPRLLSVQVWDKSMVKAVEKAIVDSNLGLSPATEAVTEGGHSRYRSPEDLPVGSNASISHVMLSINGLDPLRWRRRRCLIHDARSPLAHERNEAVRGVLQQGIESQGASIRDYRRPDGGYGSAQERFAVYGRTGEPCEQCGTPIEAYRRRM